MTGGAVFPLWQEPVRTPSDESVGRSVFGRLDRGSSLPQGGQGREIRLVIRTAPSIGPAPDSR